MSTISGFIRLGGIAGLSVFTCVNSIAVDLGVVGARKFQNPERVQAVIRTQVVRTSRFRRGRRFTVTRRDLSPRCRYLSSRRRVVQTRNGPRTVRTVRRFPLFGGTDCARPGNLLWRSVCVSSGRRVDRIRFQVIGPSVHRPAIHIRSGNDIPRNYRCLTLGMSRGRAFFNRYFRAWHDWARSVESRVDLVTLIRLLRTRIFNRRAQECIVRISGTTGVARHKRKTRSIFSLTVHTSWGRRMTWGRPGPRRFDMRAPRGHEISMIRVFQGRELDAIGAVTRFNVGCFRRGR